MKSYTLDDLVIQITSSVDPSWSTLKKFRYVYIELGIYINKNKSLLDKLIENIKTINNIDSSLDIEAYSLSFILMKCLDYINIESRIDNSNIVINYNDNEIIFSLFNDLIPLSYNMKTNYDLKYENDILRIDSELGYISISNKNKIKFYYNDDSISFYRKYIFKNNKYLDINDKTIYINDLIDQSIINKKIEDSLIDILGCNKEKREFNKLRYDEQINFIRIIIQLLFGDINDKNCLYDKNGDFLPQIYNIVDFKLIRLLSDGSYNLIIIIDNSNKPIYLSYNLSSNKLKSITKEKLDELLNKNIDSTLLIY